MTTTKLTSTVHNNDDFANAISFYELYFLKNKDYTNNLKQSENSIDKFIL
jgi:hypothetical protein